MLLIIVALFSIVFLNNLTYIVEDVDRSLNSTRIDLVCIDAQSSFNAYFFSFNKKTNCLLLLVESSILMTSCNLLFAFKLNH